MVWPDPSLILSQSSGPSRIGFAARAARGYVLDCPLGLRVEALWVRPKNALSIEFGGILI